MPRRRRVRPFVAIGFSPFFSPFFGFSPFFNPFFGFGFGFSPFHRPF